MMANHRIGRLVFLPYISIVRQSIQMLMTYILNRDESYEKPQQSRLYKSKKESVPFKLPPRGSFPIHRRNITIISGSGSHSNSMFTLMPYAFSRMYYAHRNGYRHVHTLSNKYTPHYGHFFLNVSRVIVLFIKL